MKAIIISGGKGKRLGSLTKNKPKSMINIGGKPIIEHQIEIFNRYGITDIILCTGFLSEAIEDFIKNYESNINISYSTEIKPLGTAGCIRKLLNMLDDDFLVVYGDIMFDINLNNLIDYHFKKKSEVTLVVHPNDHPYDSDLVEVSSDYRIINFLNKPHKEELIYRNLVNAGVYILSKKVFDYIKPNLKQDFIKDIFPQMLKDESQLYAYNTPEYIKDMGTIGRLKLAEEDFHLGRIESLNLSKKRSAIFMDRDGVINEEIDQLCKIKDFRLIPKAQEAIKKINNMGYLAVVITNQPAIAKGFCSIEEVGEIHKKMETFISREKAIIDRIYYCPHHPEKGFPGENLEYKVDCNCRKPKIGMITSATKDLNIDLKNSFFIGDRKVDIKTAENAGVSSIGVRTGYGCRDKEYKVNPDYWADDLYDAVCIIQSLKEHNNANNKKF